MSLIHIARNNAVIGQSTEEDVRIGLSDGTYLRTDLAWRTGLAQWKPLGEWPEFAAPGAVPPPVTVEQEHPPVPTPAWERRNEAGFFKAVVGTTKEVLMAPQTTFAYMTKTGGLIGPLSYYLTPHAISALIMAACAAIFFASMIGGLGAVHGETNPAIDAIKSLGPAGLATITLVVFTIWIPIVIFLGAAILHLLLKLWGACNAPYETTFRVLVYTWGASAWIMIPLQVLSFIPCLGIMFSMIAMAVSIWILVIQIIGLAKAHAAPTGRVVGAVLTPVLLCCCLYAAGIAAVFLSVAAKAASAHP